MIALKVKWTRWRIMILVFDIIIIISFVLTWWELLKVCTYLQLIYFQNYNEIINFGFYFKESEIKLMAKQAMYSKLPDECRLGEVSIFKSVLLFFGKLMKLIQFFA